MVLYILKKILLILVVPILLVLAFVVFRKSIFKNSDNWNNDSKFEMETSNNKYFSHFPVRLEDFYSPPKVYGLWPFGEKGNNSSSHNEGHPGWDFELKKGSKVYAISDLYIMQIHDGDTKNGDRILKVIEAYTMLEDKRFHIVYHSVTNLEKEVVEGATIAAGKPLAEAGFSLSDDSTMIHFGVFQPKDSVGSCPTPYFSEDLQPVIAEMVARSIDVKTGKPFESACVGKIDKEIYLRNFPDRVKYLEGNEEFY